MLKHVFAVFYGNQSQNQGTDNKTANVTIVLALMTFSTCIKYKYLFAIVTSAAA